MTWGTFGLAVRLLVAVLFLHSVGHALRSRANFAQFRSATTALSGIGSSLVTPLAATVLGMQAVAAGSLLVPAARQVGLGLSCVLLLGFAIALGSAVRRADGTTCRCFGPGGDVVRLAHVIRNLGLVAVLAAAWWLEPGDQLLAEPTAVAALAAAVGAIIVAHLDDVLYLAGGPAAPAGPTGTPDRRTTSGS